MSCLDVWVEARESRKGEEVEVEMMTVMMAGGSGATLWAGADDRWR